jgi:hypothetical protein
MAFELITAPTGGAPLTINDYDAQNQFLTACINKLMSDQLHLTEWDTLNEPKIKQGVYVQHGGALFIVNDANEDISGAGGLSNGRVYIKITRVGDVLTASFTNSAIGYSWDYQYCSFYHADGTQLLPYVIYKTIGNYEKYNLKFSEDKFDITANLHIPFCIEIGTWDMTGGSTKSVNIPVKIQNKILSNLIAIVRKDSSFTYRDKFPIWTDNLAVGNTEPSGGCSIDDQFQNFTLSARSGMFFDNADFNSTSDNRGWIGGQYIV